MIHLTLGTGPAVISINIASNFLFWFTIIFVGYWGLEKLYLYWNTLE